jgi:hypothetical protein
MAVQIGMSNNLKRLMITVLLCVGAGVSTVLALVYGEQSHAYFRVTGSEVPAYSKPDVRGPVQIVALLNRGETFEIIAKKYDKEFLYYEIEVGGKIAFVLHDPRVLTLEPN